MDGARPGVFSYAPRTLSAVFVRAVPSVVLLIGAIFGAGALAQRAPATIGVDEIRAGMSGYGLTVFRGTQPERFDVEVIDVLHGFRPDQDLILIKTPHPTLEHARSVGGMSGSPIYIEGRLAGAYAYGWPFGQDPVAGVTPIRNMFAEMDRPFRPDSFPGARPLPARTPRRAQAPARSRRPAGLEAYRGERVGPFDNLRAHLRARPSTVDTRMKPATTPLMMGGFTDDVAAMLAQELEPLGWTPLQGGGGDARRQSTERPGFVDGAAIGVQLVRGDISATAIGTVTHVGTGQRLVAFGHPMMNAGELGLPTATARVLHILASTARSFKIAEAVQPYGALVHDRQAAIVVDTGVEAATIPMRLRLNGLVQAPRTEWNVEIASHRLLAPTLVFSTLANAIKAASSDQTDVMYEARYTVRIDGLDPISLTDHGYMGAGPADARELMSLRLFDLMEVAYGNAFVDTRVTGIDLELDVRFADETMQIVEAWVGATEVDPGSTVDIRVRLRRYDQEEVVRSIPVRIPERLAGDSVKVELTPGSRVRIEQPIARGIEDLVERVRDTYDATTVVAELRMPSRGLRFPGHVVRSLPRSALDALSRDSGTLPGRAFVTQERQSIDVGTVVTGSAELTLQVREHARTH